MSNLENLTSKILEDSKREANEILEKAKKEANSLLSSKEKSAELVKNDLMGKAKLEAESRKQRLISSAELQGRNEKLKAKQQVIESTFEKAIEKLSKMSKEDFVKFLKESISSLNLQGGEEILVSKDFKEAITPEVLTELKLELCKDDRNIPSGFIIINEGIEYNYTFKALANSLREELEYEVAGILFN